MNILFIGDIFGKAGRKMVAARLPDLVSHHAVDLVIANGENAAAGFGITPSLAEEFLALGILSGQAAYALAGRRDEGGEWSGGYESAAG